MPTKYYVGCEEFSGYGEACGYADRLGKEIETTVRVYDDADRVVYSTWPNITIKPFQDGYFQYEIEFNGGEANGKIILREGPYGLEVICPDVSEHALGLLDLFYNKNKDGPPLQFIFYSPEQTEDPVGRVRFFPGQTTVDFELGTKKWVASDKDGTPVRTNLSYGIPRSEE